MLRLTIPNGTYQTILTLFGATESLIGCPITDFINFFTSNKVGREKKILPSNLVNFMFSRKHE